MPRKSPVADDAMALESIVHVGSALARTLEAATRRAGGVCLSRHHVLVALSSADPSPLEPRQLAAAIGSGSAHVTMLLDRLEAAGLVERRPHPGDRRRRDVVLTDAGRDCVAATSAAVATTARGVLARVGGIGAGDVLAVAVALDQAVGDVGGPLPVDGWAARPGAPIPGGR